MHASGGGYCDCGDEEAWTQGAWCSLHAGDEADASKAEGEEVFRSVDEERREETERLQSRLDLLPADVKRRFAFLLKPLISSATFVLFDIIQASSLLLHTFQYVGR